MNTSFAYNSTIVNFGEFTGSISRHRRPRRCRGSDEPRPRATATSTTTRRAGSGIGNVYVNAKWLFKISGLYQLPCDVNVSAFYNARQGYPFERIVQAPSRINGAGTPTILLDPVGESRLPNYQNLDFHVERPIKIGTDALHPVARHLQRGELQHDSGDPQHAERGERQPDPGDSRAARHPVRRSSSTGRPVLVRLVSLIRR